MGESAFHNYRHGDSSVRYFVLSDARKDLVKGCNQEEDLTNQEDRHLTCKEEDTTKEFDDGSNSTSDNKDKDLSSRSVYVNRGYRVLTIGMYSIIHHISLSHHHHIRVCEGWARLLLKTHAVVILIIIYLKFKLF